MYAGAQVIGSTKCLSHTDGEATWRQTQMTKAQTTEQEREGAREGAREGENRSDTTSLLQGPVRPPVIARGAPMKKNHSESPDTHCRIK